MKIAITSAKRTPWGSFLGAFKTISATELGGYSLKSVLPDDTSLVDAVYVGCVLQSGLGENPARQAAHLAGLSWAVPSATVNKVCGSSLFSIIEGCKDIALGYASCVLASGIENLSRVPFASNLPRVGVKTGPITFNDLLLKDGLEDAYSGKLMGTLAEQMAKQYNLTRSMQETYARESYSRYFSNLENIKKEMIPVNNLDQDEPPLKVNPEKFEKLKPAFGGTITAGTSSSLADGSASVCLMNEKLTNNLNLEPLAWIVGFETFSSLPEEFASAPVQAINRLCSKMGWNIKDIDWFEINEAFALIPLIAIQELCLDPAQVNPRGGSCILGHPLGATGARLVVTLANGLFQNNLNKGMAVACIGGGEAIAIALER